MGGDAWPQFRGPGGQGHADDADLPLHWSETSGIVWKSPVPGRGWSSPVVGDGLVWITAAEEFPPTEAEAAALLKTVAHYPLAREMMAVGSIRLSALAFDLDTGRLVHNIELFKVTTPRPIHQLNTYASPTPVLGDGKVFCHFGAFGTAGVDASTGDVTWRRTFVIDHLMGPGSSPVLHRGMLIVPCDGGDVQFVVAVDGVTGKTLWRTDRPPIRDPSPDQRKAYSTPLVIDFQGQEQVIVPGAQWFVAYDPATGREIWRLDHGGGYSNVPRPVFDGEVLYLCSGFGRPQLWAVRPDGTGEIGESQVAWRFAQQAPTMPSPAIVNDQLLTISDVGVATCIDKATGEPVWRDRIAGKYAASPLVGAGRAYLCSQDGRTTVIALGDRLEVLARNQLDGQILASPAAVDGNVILRTATHLYRLGGE